MGRPGRAAGRRRSPSNSTARSSPSGPGRGCGSAGQRRRVRGGDDVVGIGDLPRSSTAGRHDGRVEDPESGGDDLAVRPPSKPPRLAK